MRWLKASFPSAIQFFGLRHRWAQLTDSPSRICSLRPPRLGFKALNFASKRRFSIISYFAAAIIAFSAAAPAASAGFTTADTVAYWFACRQVSDGLVLPEGTDSFSVRDQALAAIVFLVRGHYHRAGRILAYFENLKNRDKEGFKGFYTNYQLNGEPLSSEINPATQLWLINAASLYAAYTGDKEYIKFARDLAKAVFSMEGPEGGIAAGFVGGEPIAYIKTSENILACSVFSGLWNSTQSSEYRFAGYRACQYINNFLSDGKGGYATNNLNKTNYPPDAIDAMLVFEGRKPRDIPDASALGFEDKLKLALYYAKNDDPERSEEILNDVASCLVFSRIHLGAAALPYRKGGSDLDIAASAWYIFASEEFSPYPKYPSAWKDTDHYFQTHNKFSGDDFEQGSMKTMLVYYIKSEEGFSSRPRLDWIEDKETLSGVLRVYMPEKPGNANAKITIARTFLEPQDFSSVSSFKFWVKGVPGFGMTQPEVRIGLGLVDGDGELWISPDMAFLTRFKYSDTVQFTAGWEKDKASPPGNGLLDFENIKEFIFILTQKSDNPWDIVFDNLTLQ